ncbi:hypothetical protein [Sphingobium sp. ZW T5_29]|uniref:hypothetical protein n=1 Tax=Sphingobium sp. ZW T5_29 TaxID=3378077 RepID=UPI0038530B62
MGIYDEGRRIVGTLSRDHAKAFWHEITKRPSGGSPVDREAIKCIFVHYPQYSAAEIEEAIRYGLFADR